MIFLQVINMVVVVCAVFSMYRSNQVFAFRMWLLDEASRGANIDIKFNREWAWRYNTLRSVSYGYMMRKFWVPLTPNRWFKDQSFIREGVAIPTRSFIQPIKQNGQ